MVPISLGPYCLPDSSTILGHGAFALVLLGHHSETLEKVAVRTIRRHNIISSALNKELAVLEDLKALKHKNLISLLYYEKTPENLYMVTEYCNGGDFEEYLQSCGGRLSEYSIACFLKQMASALHAMHQRNVVHRDLKPANILLHHSQPAKTHSRCSSSIKDITFKIADFGFARILQQGNMAVTMCGSPIYMAPEIHTQQSYCHKADLFSLGAIAYQSLTGHAPFVQKSHAALADFYHRTRRLSVRLPEGTDAQLADLLRRLLIKQSSERIEFEDFFKHDFILRDLKSFSSSVDRDIVEIDDENDENDNRHKSKSSKNKNNNFEADVANTAIFTDDDDDNKDVNNTLKRPAPSSSFSSSSLDNQQLMKFFILDHASSPPNHPSSHTPNHPSNHTSNHPSNHTPNHTSKYQSCDSRTKKNSSPQQIIIQQQRRHFVEQQLRLQQQQKEHLQLPSQQLRDLQKQQKQQQYNDNSILSGFCVVAIDDVNKEQQYNNLLNKPLYNNNNNKNNYSNFNDNTASDNSLLRHSFSQSMVPIDFITPPEPRKRHNSNHFGNRFSFRSTVRDGKALRACSYDCPSDYDGRNFITELLTFHSTPLDPTLLMTPEDIQLAERLDFLLELVQCVLLCVRDEEGREDSAGNDDDIDVSADVTNKNKRNGVGADDDDEEEEKKNNKGGGRSSRRKKREQLCLLLTAWKLLLAGLAAAKKRFCVEDTDFSKNNLFSSLLRELKSSCEEVTDMCRSAVNRCCGATVVESRYSKGASNDLRSNGAADYCGGDKEVKGSKNRNSDEKINNENNTKSHEYKCGKTQVKEGRKERMQNGEMLSEMSKGFSSTKLLLKHAFVAAKKAEIEEANEDFEEAFQHYQVSLNLLHWILLNASKQQDLLTICMYKEIVQEKLDVLTEKGFVLVKCQ